jgi:hypothetical protein
MTSYTLDAQCAIVFLVINQIPDLPVLAINSVLQNSNSPIYIGTIREVDRENLPENSRISFIDLSSDASALGISADKGLYESFEKDEFFSLVQLKWALFRKVSEVRDIDFLIYNDIDVFWLRPVLPDLVDAFSASPEVQMMIQHFTWVPGQPQLCMGFVAFRFGAYFEQLISRASQLHSQMLITNPRSGDDDVITALYRREGFPIEMQLLPQTTFPVGNLLNLFSKKDEFSGLEPFRPYIFHANFVVGIKKKLLITKIAYRLHGIPFNSVNWSRRINLNLYYFGHRIIFTAKRIAKSLLR